MQPDDADLVLVVAQPTAKSLNIAKRAVDMTDDRGGRVIVVANRVRNDEYLAVIREAVGDCEMVVVPDDAAIARADREGRAAIDVDPDSPGVKVLIGLADRLASMAVPA